MRDEFPEGASLPPDEMSRREFMRVMGASLAMTGAVSCTKQPSEEIVPYVRQPEDLVLGDAQYYATAMDIGGHAQGLLVCSHEGRPTKIEGNPDHPITRGRSSVLMQAALLDLYDPDRSQSVRKEGMAGTWEDFLSELLMRSAQWKSEQGRGLRLLVDSRSSPTLQEQIQALQQKYPKLECHRYDAAFPEAAARTSHDFARAKVILALDADFLGAPDAIAKGCIGVHGTQKAGRRHQSPLCHRIDAQPDGSDGGSPANDSPITNRGFGAAIVGCRVEGKRGSQRIHGWPRCCANFQKNRGESAVLAGRFLPESVQRIAGEINERLGNVGHTVFPQPSLASLPGLESVVKAMHAGEVSALVMMGANPAFTAPDELRFAEALAARALLRASRFAGG